MAEETENEEADGEEDEDGEGKPKKSKKKLILFIGLPVIILLLGGAAAMLLLGGKKDEEVADAHGEVDAHGEPVAGDHAEAHVPLFYKMPGIVVNISGEKPGDQMVLSLKMQLEIPDEDTRHQLDAMLPRVVDRFQAFLRELRVEDIKGSAGNYRLRLELLRRVNLAIQPTHVTDVLIEELVVS